MNTVLITGARTIVSLDLARMFRKKGWQVILADSLRFVLGQFSLPRFSYLKYPSARYQTQNFCEQIIKIIKAHNVDLIIPTAEEVFYLAQHKSAIEAHCRVFCDSLEKLLKLHDKLAFAQLVQEVGLPYLATKEIKDQHKFARASSCKEQIILKPRYSRFGNQIVYPPVPEKAQQKAWQNHNGSWLRQRKLSGNQYCTYSLVNKGKLVAHSCYPVHFKVGSACIDFKAVIKPDIERWVKKFVKEISFHGQIGFDFIYENGTLYAIECNPRATSGLHLFQTTQALVDCFDNQTTPCVLRPKSTQTLSLKAMLLYHIVTQPSNRPLEVLKTLANSSDVVQRPKNHIMPGSQTFLIGYLLSKAVMFRKSLLQITTDDLEWNQQEF